MHTIALLSYEDFITVGPGARFAPTDRAKMERMIDQ